MAKKKVLIVDDDPTVVKMMNIYFTNSGMETRVEGSGENAIKAIADFKPDVLILDIRMPKMDGVKVCLKIRNELNNRTMPIIALTGFHKDETKRQILAAGANLYLTKPIDMAKLLKQVKELTGGSNP